MGKISPALLQKIKDSVDLVSLIEEHVVLKKSGSQKTGICPFHAERTPSFTVSPQKQLYHCYGCKKGGDLISFVMDIYGMNFSESIEELADRAKINLPADFSPETKTQKESREKQSLYYKLNRFAAAYYHQKLKQTPEMLEYFTTRGVTPELIRNYYLGASHSEWDGLSLHLESKKAPLGLALELGLIRPSKKRGGYFDLFRNRVLFPILDLRGKIAGFGGRLLVPAQDSPKYLNSNDSQLFQKNKLAYGLFHAQKHIRDLDEVIVVEGYFDVLAMHAHGFLNAIATCGTSLTEEHLKIFRKLTSKITLLFDGDKAGQEATQRAMLLGLRQGVILYGTTLPFGMDPDEVLLEPEGTEKMKDILSQSKPLLDARIHEEIKKAVLGPEEKTKAIKKITEWLSHYNDPIGKEMRLEAAASTLGIRKELFGFKNTVQPSQRRLPSERPKATAKSAFTPREKILLCAIAQEGVYSTIIAETEAKLPPSVELEDLFEFAPAAHWVRDHKYKQNSGQFLDLEINSEIKSTLAELLLQPTPKANLNEIKIAFDRALIHVWARFSHGLETKLKEAEQNKDSELQEKILKEYLDVQRKMKEFKNFYDYDQNA